MPSKLSWLALGAGAYLAITIAKFPAAAAYRWFAPEGLRLAGVTGTLWSGSAALGSFGDLGLRDVTWQLELAALLTGSLGVDFQTRLADGFVNGDVAVSPGGIVLRDVRGSTSLQTLREALPVYGLEGQVSVALERLELENGWPTAAVGELRVADLEAPPLLPTAGVALVPLGSFRAQFVESAEPGIAALVTDTGGPIELEGRVALGVDRAYTIDALVRTRPDASDLIVQGLAMMSSEPDADGRRQFAMSGTLRGP